MSNNNNSTETTERAVIFQDINTFTRVTEVLYPFSGLDKIDQSTVEHAAQRGSRVHEICEGIMMGLPAMGADAETQPYIDSFMEWWGSGHKIIAMEKRFYDHDLLLTGQVDLIIEEPDKQLSIVDLKTSYRPSKTWPLQGAAYARMARADGYNIQNIKFLHLNKYGKAPKMHVYPDQWDLYAKCLDVYRYFFEKKKK